MKVIPFRINIVLNEPGKMEYVIPECVAGKIRSSSAAVVKHRFAVNDKEAFLQVQLDVEANYDDVADKKYVTRKFVLAPANSGVEIPVFADFVGTVFEPSPQGSFPIFVYEVPTKILES